MGETPFDLKTRLYSRTDFSVADEDFSFIAIFHMAAPIAGHDETSTQAWKIFCSPRYAIQFELEGPR